MKIALLGYGKMGKAIEEVAINAGHEIVVRIDSDEDWRKYGETIVDADVAFEFSTPGTVSGNIKKCFERKVPVVVGTTSWEADFDEIKKQCIDGKNTMFVASNFSVGVNLLFRINRQLSALMSRFPQYDVMIREVHHQHKLDAPSGTAKILAGDIIENLNRKKAWVNHDTAESSELKIMSERHGVIPGTHVVKYESDEDIIEITHVAKSRIGFVKGALMAAEWLIGKNGFYTMEDMIKE